MTGSLHPLARVLGQLRKERSMPRRHLFQVSGVSESVISRYETPGRTVPMLRGDTLDRAADALGYRPVLVPKPEAVSEPMAYGIRATFMWPGVELVLTDRYGQEIVLVLDRATEMALRDRLRGGGGHAVR